MQAPPQALRDDPGGSSADPSASSSEHPMDHEHETGGGGQTQSSTAEPEPPEGAVYRCRMHPEVKASAPGAFGPQRVVTACS